MRTHARYDLQFDLKFAWLQRETTNHVRGSDQSQDGQRFYQPPTKVPSWCHNSQIWSIRSLALLLYQRKLIVRLCRYGWAWLRSQNGDTSRERRTLGKQRGIGMLWYAYLLRGICHRNLAQEFPRFDPTTSSVAGRARLLLQSLVSPPKIHKVEQMSRTLRCLLLPASMVR